MFSISCKKNLRVIIADGNVSKKKNKPQGEHKLTVVQQ